MVAGRREPCAWSSTSPAVGVRGCPRAGSWGHSTGCMALPAQAAEARTAPRLPWEKTGVPKQDSWQGERLCPGGQGKHMDSGNLDEAHSLMASVHLYHKLCG